MNSLLDMLVGHSPAGRTLVADHMLHLLQKLEHLLAAPYMNYQSRSTEKPLLAAAWKQTNIKSPNCTSCTTMSKILLSIQSNDDATTQFQALLKGSDTKDDNRTWFSNTLRNINLHFTTATSP